MARLSCGGATPAVDHPTSSLTRAVPLGDVLWLGVYPYRRGYPTKVVVESHGALANTIVVRGRRCGSGRLLRFWFREGEPFRVVPTSAARLRSTGTLRIAVGPYPADGSGGGGYFNFWAGGKWKIVAYEQGRLVGVAILDLTNR
jgi:hypothetical protein